tara:strand:+ start:33206 stop:33670 length:465 start_codon:yes stop_codon:yes gene_type:complete
MKIIGLAVLLAFGANGAAAAVCDANRVTVKGDFGQAGFTVQVADDDEERARGLMNVSEMPTMAGMFFVYDAPQRATFWMRNTLIGLDMIFAGPDGTILSIHENAVPMDETVIDGGSGVVAVLEVNGGMTGRLGIKTGDILQHPAFGPDAISPCE